MQRGQLIILNEIDNAYSEHFIRVASIGMTKKNISINNPAHLSLILQDVASARSSLMSGRTEVRAASLSDAGKSCHQDMGLPMSPVTDCNFESRNLDLRCLAGPG